MAASSELSRTQSLATHGTFSHSHPRIRTVVVDDSDTFLKVICYLLDREDVIDLVAAASDGVEAINTVSRVKPDLVLMDVNMPGLDGLAAASLLADMAPAPTVILMSSEDTPQLRASCKKSRAFDFVSKTNFQNDFDAVLQRIVKIHNRTQTLA